MVTNSKEYDKAYYVANRAKIRARQSGYKPPVKPSENSKLLDIYYRSRYKISYADYVAILEKQKNVCAICGKTETQIYAKTGKVKRLTVDHCHNTGKVRGLLCMMCNTAIGKLNDDVSLVEKALNYLKEHA